MVFDEVVITRLQLAPKSDVVRRTVSLQVLVGHAERVDTDINPALTISERGFDITINLIHIGVGHRVTPN
ncbi:hypothetical protein D3C78_1438210 [compost metagenome]